MKKKSIATITLACLIAVSSLVGCGKSSSSIPSSDKLDTSKEVELVMYQLGDKTAKQDTLDENLNKILKEKLNCTLKINEISWADYTDKYPLLFSSGEVFDFAYAATWLDFATLAHKGAFMSLDDIWEKYAPKNFAAQSKSALQQATIDGHYYCVPTLLGTYNAYGPIYRTDLVEGTDWNGKMENFEDVESYLSIVKKANPEMAPLDLTGGSEWDDIFMYYNGFKSTKDGTDDFLFYDASETNPKLTTYYEFDKTKDFLSMMFRWCENGYFSKSVLSDTDGAKMKEGKSAMALHNIDNFVSMSIDHPEYELQYANFVKHSAHLPYTQDAMVIPSSSQNPERTLALWDLITSDREVFDAFMYGIQGTSYELNDKGEIKALDEDNYGFSAMWCARTPDLNRQSYGTLDVYKTLTDSFENSISEDNCAEKFAGFTIDTTSIETEYSACQNVHKQYWWPLELGYVNVDTGLAEYQSKMEAAGIEKVKAELQKQLDQFVADNN